MSGARFFHDFLLLISGGMSGGCILEFMMHFVDIRRGVRGSVSPARRAFFACSECRKFSFCGPGHSWDPKMQELISGGYPADVAADTDP